MSALDELTEHGLDEFSAWDRAINGEPFALTLTPAVTAASQTINAAPTAATLTAANTKSFTGTLGQIALPAIVPVANGAGITLTGINFSQGAITNAADSEAITVKGIVMTGAAGKALATGAYTWTAIDITVPGQAANAAANAATGLKIVGGAVAGGATAYQRGIDIAMAAATDAAIFVSLGTIVVGPTAYSTPATGRGDIIISHSAMTGPDSQGGIEFLTDTFGSGYGWKVMAVDPDSDSLMPIVFASRSNATGFTSRFRFTKAGNLLLAGATTVGTSASGEIAIGQSTAPTTAPADMIQMWAADFASGDTALYVLSETGTKYSFGAGLSVVLPTLTANGQSFNTAPSANTLTAANTKSYTHVAGQIVLPAITPAANGAGITLTGLALSQGAIGNVADSEAITVTQVAITGAAGQASETGIYTWTGLLVTTPNLVNNGAANLGYGLKVTCGTVAGTSVQYGVHVTGGASNYGLYSASGSNFVAEGILIGAAVTGNLLDDASNGAGSTPLYIGNAQITVLSDMRVKTDITATRHDAMKLLRQLHVVDFAWDDPSDRNPFGKNSRGRYTGILAQEAIDVVPWIINAEDRSCPKCRKGIHCEDHRYPWQAEYAHMVPLVVKGLQELEARIMALERK